jgi:hypothetical protein
MERGDSMSIVIKAIHEGEGITATDQGNGAYLIKGGTVPLVVTRDQAEADQYAYAYVHGLLDGKRAERNRVKEDV